MANKCILDNHVTWECMFTPGRTPTAEICTSICPSKYGMQLCGERVKVNTVSKNVAPENLHGDDFEYLG